MDFSHFDRRGYPTVTPRQGYREWASSYETTVEDEMDIAVLERLESVDWSRVGRAADLGCGTGRTGDWLRAQGVDSIDGIDYTPEMLERAREKGIYDALHLADVAATGLETAAYDLVTTVLVDEHLPSLDPLYREAARLLTPSGRHVLIGYHPHFMMATGMPTHFERADGERVAIETHVHLLSDHVRAAHDVGFTLAELRERVIDDRWVELKPKWDAYRGVPFSFAMVWRLDGPELAEAAPGRAS